MSTDSKVGFKSYQMADGTPVILDKHRAEIDAQAMRFIDTTKMFYREVKPEPWTIRRVLSEARYRLNLAFNALRHGRDYFD